MINANGYQQYRYNSIMSASPERLMIMLFEGAIKFVRLAKKAELGRASCRERV